MSTKDFDTVVDNKLSTQGVLTQCMSVNETCHEDCYAESVTVCWLVQGGDLDFAESIVRSQVR
jgi:hypothetical protein